MVPDQTIAILYLLMQNYCMSQVYIDIQKHVLSIFCNTGANFNLFFLCGRRTDELAMSHIMEKEMSSIEGNRRVMGEVE